MVNMELLRQYYPYEFGEDKEEERADICVMDTQAVREKFMAIREKQANSLGKAFQDIKKGERQ